jgi:hypothetical protein
MYEQEMQSLDFSLVVTFVAANYLTQRLAGFAADGEDTVVLAVVAWILSYLWTGATPKPATEKYRLTDERKQRIRMIASGHFDPTVQRCLDSYCNRVLKED